MEHMTPEVWLALIALVTPLVAGIAANLSLRSSVVKLTQQMAKFSKRLTAMERSNGQLPAMAAHKKPGRKAKKAMGRK